MSLLTEQEMQAMWNTASSYNPVWMWHLAYARDIEAKARAKLIEEIKAQGPAVSVLKTEDVVKFIHKKALPMSDHWQQTYKLPSEGE